MRNCEYHRGNGRNKGVVLREEMRYVEQSRFEQYLETLGLSNDSIAYVLARPHLLNAGYRMVSKDPQLSLEEAIMRCVGMKHMPEETEQVCAQQTTAEESDVEDQALPLGIRTIGNFIPISGRNGKSPNSTSVAACPFSRLPEKYRKQVECQVLGLYRDDPFDGSHGPEHDMSHERD